MAESNKTAGLFDIRNIIGALMAVYGVILILMGIFGNKEGEKTGDVNANLWAGLAMLVFAASFALWSRLRPIVVDPGASVSGDDDGPPGH